MYLSPVGVVVIAGFWFFLIQLFKYTQAHIKLRPTSVPIRGFSSAFAKWISSLVYFLRCESVASRAYEQSRGKPFAISTLWNYHVCISDTEKLNEFNKAPPSQLSLNEFLTEAVFPEYTINGFRFDPADPRSKLSVRALMGGLRANLPLLKPRLQDVVHDVFRKEVSDRCDQSGWSQISAKRLGHLLTANTICLVVLGERIFSDPENVKTAVQYTWDAMLTSQLLGFLPAFSHPVIGTFMMKRTGACRRLHQVISAEVQMRIQQRREKSSTSSEKPLDCIQWMLDVLPDNDDKTAHEVTQRAIGMIFAGMFQPEMFLTFALYNLCAHPEYIEPLREAVRDAGGNLGVDAAHNKDLPLLDSFLKEVARLNPLRAVSIDRKVMHDFTFGDGTTVAAGNHVCVPQQAVMLNAELYRQPLEFQGFRFANEVQRDAELGGDRSWESDTRFTHPSQAFPFWGAVSRPCPARFYVSSVLKIVMVHVLQEYDIKLAKEMRSPTVSWGPNVVPHPRIAFQLRPRKASPA